MALKFRPGDKNEIRSILRNKGTGGIGTALHLHDHRFNIRIAVPDEIVTLPADTRFIAVEYSAQTLDVDGVVDQGIFQGNPRDEQITAWSQDSNLLNGI